jgi:hypothetical protein
MFPVFPVLFSVCSHFPAKGFIVFPAFPVSAARAMSTVSCIPFLHAGNTGNSGNWIALERLADSARVEQTWNNREQGSVEPTARGYNELVAAVPDELHAGRGDEFLPVQTLTEHG